MMQNSSTNIPRYLLVKHSRGWNVDRCCTWMERNKQPFDWYYPVEGGAFPAAQHYAGIVIFGGASSANDDCTNEWVRKELAFIEDVLKYQVPFLGICLGAQMLARVLGSVVFKHPEDQKEVGFHKVYPTADSGDFLPAPQHFMQWHSEGFALPSGCVSTACGKLFENQAFRYADNVHAVQFHPEVNPAALAIWHERNQRKNPQPLSAAERQQQMLDAQRYDASINQWMDTFLARWTEQAAGEQAAGGQGTAD